MPVSIGEYARERREVTHQLPQGELKLVYAPHRLTPSDEARLDAARKEGSIETYKALLEQLCKMLVGWDLVGPLYNTETGDEIVGDGESVPIQPDILQHLPSAFLGEVYGAIMADNRPKESSQTNQVNASQRTSGKVYQGSFS